MTHSELLKIYNFTLRYINNNPKLNIKSLPPNPNYPNRDITPYSRDWFEEHEMWLDMFAETETIEPELQISARDHNHISIALAIFYTILKSAD